MDRNTLIGFLLIGLLLIGYTYYNQKQVQKHREAKRELQSDTTRTTGTSFGSPDQEVYETQTPIATTDTLLPGNVVADTLATRPAVRSMGPFELDLQAEPVITEVETDLLRVSFSNQGGKLHSVELKEYTTHDQQPLILFEGDERNFGLLFWSHGNRDINTSDLFFTTEGPVTEEDGAISITMTAKTTDGAAVIQEYKLTPDSYLIDHQIRLEGMDRHIPRNANYLELYWKAKIRKLEKDRASVNRYTRVFYRFKGDDVESLSESGTDEAKLSTSVNWVSFKQAFFNSTLIAQSGFESGRVRSAALDDKDEHVKLMSTDLVIPYTHQKDFAFQMTWYYGPNHYQTLRKMGNEMEDVIELGSGIFAWVSIFNKYLIIPVFNFLNNYITNYGIIILILTIMLKMVLFPLTYKSFLSAAKMKVLKPELDALKEKYKDDQQKFGMEQWKLFQQAGVNPLGGCIPMLLQMPILVAMYYFFPASIELRQAEFLWATDLSTYDSVYDLPFTIPFYGDHVSLFTLLMAVTSILYATTNPQMTTSGPGANMMKWMPYVFPIMLLGIFNNFPAGLTYYYFLTNLISFFQQLFIKKFVINEEELHRQLQENKKKPVKKSGWAKRLEEVARQQQELQKKRGKK